MILIPIILLILIYLYFKNNSNKLIKYFKKSSVIVFGKKGKGKDLLFQHVIKHRKKPYYSNIPYGYKYYHLDLKDIDLSPNTFNNFIKGNIQKVPNLLYDKMDYYISDAGVYLPSQYHSLLDKTYMSLPIYYALSRHLNLMNIHINTQALNRVWDKLREQADYYIKVKSTFRIFNLFFTTIIIYDKYQTAKLELLPFKKKLGSSETNALVRQYEATNGEIKKFTICTRKKSIKYDTRYFKSLIYLYDKDQKS